MVIKDFAAVTSQSLLDDEDSNFVQYIKNKRAVGAVERIFNGFAAKCKPLMRVYTQANAHTFFPAFKKLNEIDCALWFSSRLPSVATMPENIDGALKAYGADDVTLFDAEELAEEAGNRKCSNVALLGCAASYLPIEEEAWHKAIENRVPPKTLEANLKAFALAQEK